MQLESSPKPGDILWQPSEESIATSTLSNFVRYLNSHYHAALPIGAYDQLHTWSITHPAEFWAAVAYFTNFFPTSTSIPLRNVLVQGRDDSLPKLVNVSWFRSMPLNFAEIILRTAQSFTNRTAIIYRPESRVDDIGYKRYLTFAELKSRVHALASALRSFGVRRGDAVSGVLAHTPDAIVAMLASAALGAVWSCCSPDFGEKAICDRFVQTRPKVLLYSSCYRYKGKVHDLCTKLQVVVPQLSTLQLVLRVPGGCPASEDMIWIGRELSGVKHMNLREFESAHSSSEDEFQYEMITMDDPVLTMFSSGTTGRPKCIIQGCGVLLNQLKELVLHHEVDKECRMLYNTSTGWMLFNWQLAALGTGCTIVLYDGAALPNENPYRLIDIAEQEKVTHFGSGAKYYQALRAVTVARKDNMASKKDLRTVRMVMATASPSTMEHFTFASEFFGKQVQYASMSGGTEINGCFALGTPWKPVIAPQLQCAGLGMDVHVYNESGNSVVEESGELVCRNPCPCMPLYFGHDENHQRYKNAYFNMYNDVWSHGDFAVRSQNGGFLITGRSDSTLNPGGVRIGTSDLYQVVEGLGFIESALVTEQSIHGDTRVIMFVVMKDGMELDFEKERHIRRSLRTALSPRHVPHSIVQVPQIPVTFSGKKCEIPVRRILQGIEVNNREAVKNPEAFDSIRLTIERLGLVSRDRTPKFIGRASKM